MSFVEQCKKVKTRFYNTFVKTILDKERFIKLFISLFTVHLQRDRFIDGN